MKKLIKKYWWLSIVFVVSFICIYFVGFLNNYGDPMNNYAFSYAILRGEVPYLDFNIISTPLFPFIMSLGLIVFNNFLTFSLGQALIVTICFFSLYKLFGTKSLLMVFPTFISVYANIMATYNFFCFFIMVLIIYMENKHNDKDYLIGVLIALAILTKQTVGVFFIIPSIIFYHKDLSKLKKRFIGFLIPCSIFLIYLLVNKCLYQFFDLCLFGLFDFFKNNGIASKRIANIKYLVFSLICLVVLIVFLCKNKKNINLYYLLSGFFFAFPLFDRNHFAMFLNCLTVALVPYVKISDRIVKRVSLTCFLLSSIIFTNIFSALGLKIVRTKELNHFEYFLNDARKYKNIIQINNFFDKYKTKKNIILSYSSLPYKIYNDLDIDYFDILYYGNYGYDGTNKMIKKIKKIHKCYFIVSMDDFNSKLIDSQFNKDIVKYVIDNCEKVETNKKLNFVVYYKS